jgi:hypothetical protein
VITSSGVLAWRAVMAPLLKGFVPALAAPTGATFEGSVEPLYSSIDNGGVKKQQRYLRGACGRCGCRGGRGAGGTRETGAVAALSNGNLGEKSKNAAQEQTQAFGD